MVRKSLMVFVAVADAAAGPATCMTPNPAGRAGMCGLTVGPAAGSLRGGLARALSQGRARD